MFGPCSTKKALCSCGKIAELDMNSISLKRGLKKQVECSACRNRRVAEEYERLERHFQGLDEEDDYL